MHELCSYMQCMHVCMCKNVLIWIVIGWVLNINFELIVHLICIYIMFLLISPFYFSEDPQEKNGKISKNLLLTHCSHVINFLSPWDSHAFNIYTFPCLFLFLCLYFSLIFKLQIFRLCSLSLVSLIIFFSSHFFCSI